MVRPPHCRDTKVQLRSGSPHAAEQLSFCVTTVEPVLRACAVKGRGATAVET